jgi:phenylalanyl-tRNA synthetase beta chain
MGGASTEVSGETRDVLVESAWFTPAGIGRTSRRHLLSSEASKRFERGVDPELAPVAAERAVTLLTSLAGGTADATVTDVADLPSRPVITMSAGEPARRAGTPYSREVVERRLAQVGCTVSGTDSLTVVPPSWRPDLTLPVDLTEEVMRLEGYDQIPSTLPAARPGLGLTPRQRLVRRLGRALADAGYAEVVPYPFMSTTVLDDLLVPEGDERRRAPRIANPVSDAEPLLCTTLLPGLLASLTRNVGRGLHDVSLFQLSPVHIARSDAAAPRPGVDGRPDDATLAELDATLPHQPLHAGAVLTGLREQRGHWGNGRTASWEDAVEVVRLIGRTLNAAVDVRAGDAAPWHPGRCAEVVSGGQVVGWAGELHPRVCAALDLPPRTCAVEVDLEPLVATAVEHVTVPPLSTFPPANVDVALVVSSDTAASDVEAALRSGAGELLEGLRLFDVYTGLGEGRKSLAYQMRFRSPSESLTSEQVNAMRDAAVAEAAARTGAVLRGA